MWWPFCGLPLPPPTVPPVQELIQTYEKKDRSSSDEKAATVQQEWPLPAPTASESRSSINRLSKTFSSGTFSSGR